MVALGSFGGASIAARKAAAARAAVLAAGLGLAVALYGLLVWSPARLFADGAPDALGLAGVAASVANGAALLALGACPRPGAGVPGRASCACLVLAAAAWALVVTGVVGVSALSACLTSVLGGVALAGALAGWVRRLAALEPRRARAAVVGAAGVSGVLNLALAALPADAVAPVALAGLLVEAALLATGEQPGPHGAAAPAPQPVGAEGDRSLASCARDLLPTLAAAAVVTFVAPVVNDALLVGALPLEGRVVLSAAMDIAVALALALVWLVPRRSPSVLGVLLVFIAVLLGAVLFAGVAGSRAQLVLLGLGSAGYFLVTYLVMDASLEAARSHDLAPARVYGAAGGVVMLARVAADGVAAAVMNAGLAAESRVLVGVFLLVYLLTVAGFVLYGASVRRRSAPGARTPAPGGEAPAPAAVPPAARAAGPAPLDGWNLLARRCDLVADAFGLSPREREVLALMMRGRNVPAIAEELVVSRNTVQTHVRHVYERLGVHSRQELVALVEGYGEAADGARPDAWKAR